MLLSLIVLTIISPEKTINVLMNAGSDAVNLSIKLVGIYAVWLGFLGIVDKTGLSQKFANLLEPIIDFLFGKNLDKQTKSFLALNISTNIFGIGNASTPIGIKAMQGLDKINNSEVASNAMIMLMVINATSLQILPTTIIGLRASHQSMNSGDIIIPSIIATTLTTLLGIMLVKLFSTTKMQKLFRKKHKKHAFWGKKWQLAFLLSQFF